MKKKITNETYPKFCLSSDGLKFITEYAMSALSIDKPVTEESEKQIFEYAKKCELNMTDNDGNDINSDYPEKERDILADKYVTELSLAWAKDYVLDLDDLNNRIKQ